MPGGLIVAAPGSVFTISRVAEMLGQDEEWLQDLAMQLDPEDGRLTVYATNDYAMTAFTPFGIECLRQIVRDSRS